MTRPGDHKPDAWGPSPWALAVALAAVAGGLAWWWPAADVPPPPAPPVAAAPAQQPLAATQPAAPLPAAASAPAAAAVVAAAKVTAPAARIPRLRDPDGDQTPDLADYINEGERPTMAEVIQRLHAAGVRTGLGAFNPPGTRPPLIGLAVPENFDLPPGYVRHHQATDDGQRIEPILMFSPDTRTLVINGRNVAVPADRVVPPELAPPGLPIRRIVVPAPVDSPR
ncbi:MULTISPECIES: hypothetical protein [unclassified Roseateles]|uniref:hypothetical protein n=1 Tax=unclassified Roseateles TaxID=2626991 RepID=UPI0006FFED2F|nr:MULTISPECIES: hypothetical protein [unclassified Roseateles]KQW46409.1 hypothetical protein ASC81_08365 [Pelomonas sp. Root405]KRA73459.1 hypothetical protein ASD88_08365 [Pelomonas sp. Root662]